MKKGLNTSLNRRLLFVGLVLCLVSQSGYVIGETVTDYLPLTAGTYWTYNLNDDLGSYQETVTVLQGTKTINGIQTKALRYSGGPYDQVVEYWTNDDEGIRLHGAYYPVSDAGPVTLTFDPPLVTANKVMDLHESVKTEGQATFNFTSYEGAIFDLDYVSTYTLEGTETVTVPAGVYETVRVTGTLLITGSLGGEPFRDEESSTTWSAKYIGDVKDVTTDANGTETTTLVRTNAVLRFLPYLPLLLD